MACDQLLVPDFSSLTALSYQKASLRDRPAVVRLGRAWGEAFDALVVGERHVTRGFEAGSSIAPRYLVWWME